MNLNDLCITISFVWFNLPAPISFAQCRRLGEWDGVKERRGEKGDVTPCLLISNSACLTSLEQIRPALFTQVEVMAEKHPCPIAT